MSYTIRRKVSIENAQGETILEHTYEDGFLIWQQYDAIYGPNANPVPVVSPIDAQTPPQVPQMPAMMNETPPLRTPSIPLQTPSVETATEVPAG